MADLYEFDCPNCGAVIKTKTGVAGQLGTCRSCQQKITLPSPRSIPTGTPASPKKRGEIPSGVAGLILVLLGLLRFGFTQAKQLGDVFWFVGSFGVLISFVGLIVSIIGIFKGSGRMAGVGGVVAYGILAAIFMALKI